MKPVAIIKQFSELGGRLGLDEIRACDLVCSLLDELDIRYVKQHFKSKTPEFINYSLHVDGKEIACLPTGLSSGSIHNNYNLISSLTSSQNFIDTPNINFNPKSDAICLSNFYFAPSLAVSRNDVPKLMRAKQISGHVKVRPKMYTATNVLVGDTKTPESVVFAHYDAYFSGATDNASGVAVILKMLSDNTSLLDNNLFVFAGNEELSYDYPIYWGKCFREFKSRNSVLLRNAKQIIVVDSVGDGTPTVEIEPKLLSLAFPVGDPKLVAKSRVVTGDFDNLMTVYHSPADKPSRIKTKFINQTVRLLEELIAS